MQTSPRKPLMKSLGGKAKTSTLNPHRSHLIARMITQRMSNSSNSGSPSDEKRQRQRWRSTKMVNTEAIIFFYCPRPRILFPLVARHHVRCANRPARGIFWTWDGEVQGRGIEKPQGISENETEPHDNDDKSCSWVDPLGVPSLRCRYLFSARTWSLIPRSERAVCCGSIQGRGRMCSCSVAWNVYSHVCTTVHACDNTRKCECVVEVRCLDSLDQVLIKIFPSTVVPRCSRL